MTPPFARPHSSRRARAALVSALLIAGAMAPAFAFDGFFAQLTPADRERIAAYDRVRAEAIQDAQKGEAADRRELDKALAGTPEPIGLETLPGRWRCRTIKLGSQGGLPLELVVYADFVCRISAIPGGGLKLEKITGSQRTAGTLYPYDRDRLGYAGTSFYGYEKGPKPYGQDAERDDVGLLVRVGRDRLRLELPLPRFESKFDIIELRRP
jgi:hypothetical protein